jgi:hypothetical protein
MKYVGFWVMLATVGALGGGCDQVESGQEGSISEPGGFVDPERRLAAAGEESYCSSEVLRWRYDEASASLKVADSRLLLNCCGQRGMRVERIDSMYEITEKDEPDSVDRRCDSVCAFDFTIAIPEVTGAKAYLRLLRDVTDVQGSAELVWQGEIDLTQLAGEISIDNGAASPDVCSDPAP